MDVLSDISNTLSAAINAEKSAPADVEGGSKVEGKPEEAPSESDEELAPRAKKAGWFLEDFKRWLQASREKARKVVEWTKENAEPGFYSDD